MNIKLSNRGIFRAASLLTALMIVCAGLGPAGSSQAGSLAGSNRPGLSPLVVPNWTAESNLGGSAYGAAVASAGDINGDGYDDVIVGAPYAYIGQDMEGRIYVYFGSATGLKPLPAWVFESNKDLCEIGWSVASAGDVNGDGFADVIIGAPYYDNDLENEGRAYVFYGSAAGLAQDPNWMKEGNQPQARFGWGVASAGDVNNDGFDDVIVGAPWYAHPEANEGMAFVYHGSANGLSPDPVWTAESNMHWTSLGSSVDSAGDVNNDGYDDVIVGIDHFTNPLGAEGGAWVYHGSANGLLAIPAWSSESDQTEAFFGDSVASAGDVNGDGYDDVIVGAMDYDAGQPNEGKVYVFHGSASGLSFTPAWTAEGDKDYAEFGHSVDSAGDVNGDGYSDVIIGALWFSNDHKWEGRAYLYYGSVTGLAPMPGGIAESHQESAHYGSAVASAGDVNNDGLDDILVGAKDFDNGQDNEGRVFAYYGGEKFAIFLPSISR